MSVTITESGMNFGPYAERDIWQLERCALYQRIQQDTPMVEFAVLRRREEQAHEIWLVEAKQSVPNGTRNPERLNEYLDSLRQKMLHGLHLLLAAWTGRHAIEHTQAPEAFQPGPEGAIVARLPIRCVLVIRGAPQEFLPPIQDALRKVLRVVVSTIGLPPDAVFVINEGAARARGLITT